LQYNIEVDGAVSMRESTHVVTVSAYTKLTRLQLSKGWWHAQHAFNVAVLTMCPCSC
jgi:hypothetical protein